MQVDKEEVAEIGRQIREAVIEACMMDNRQPQYNYFQPPQQGQVTTVANNPMTWVAGMGTILAFAGLLLYVIYSSDQSSQNKAISSNYDSIQKMQQLLTNMQEIVVRIQGNQETISRIVAKNSDNLDITIKTLNRLELDKFSDEDGAALDGQIKNYVRERVDIISRDIAENRSDIKLLETKLDDLAKIKTRVDDNTVRLNERELFMKDVKERLIQLERKPAK